MTTTRNIIDIVVRHLRQGESVTALTARVEAHGGPEKYAEALLSNDLTKVEAQMRKLLREAQERTAMDQLAIPGMDYATLPRFIVVNDPDIGVITKPRHLCTLGDVKAEVAAMRRDVNTRDRVVGGYEAALSRITELGYAPEQIMADIETDMRAIEDGLR